MLAPDEKGGHWPSNIAAEQALLGSLLMQNDAYYPVADLIEPDHFYEPIHQQVYDVISKLITAGKVANPITLRAFLPEDFEVAPGVKLPQYLARLAAEATSIMLASEYAHTIREMWTRRRVIALARDLQHRAMGAIDGSVDALLEETDDELTSIRFGKTIEGVKTIAEAVCGAIDQTARAYQGTADIGLLTGVATIDAMVGPMMAGDLVTLLAPSGHGKTALAAQVIKHNALPSLDAHQGGKTSLFYSMEMPSAQIARRVIASESGISVYKQKTGNILEAEFEFLRDAAERVGPLPILFDETPGQTVSRIIRKSRALKKRHKDLALIAIDHLLEIRAENPRWSKIDTVENAVQELKRLAKELGVVVILLAQATREGQKREHWRMRTTDIWGGDRVKQSSDIVLSLAIPSVWLGEREPSPGTPDHIKWQEEAQRWHGKAEIGAPKIRDGQSGSWCLVSFDGPKMTFGEDQSAFPR